MSEFEVGQRWDIVEGEWVQNDTSGEFEVVDQPHVIDTIHAETGNLTTSKWVGKPWQFRRQDCISVAAEYMDDKYGTEYYKEYMSVTGPVYRQHVLNGVASYFDSHDDFYVIEDHNDIQVDDVLVYAMPDVNDLSSNHIALYLGDDKVFRQPPFKMTSIDPIDRDMVIKVYRSRHAR